VPLPFDWFRRARPTAKIAADQSRTIAFLGEAKSYGKSGPVQRIDTHCSVVFLVGNDAFKLKRAVIFPFLDFSTIEKRRSACEAEIAVNRPNAPLLYIGTLPIMSRNGMLSLGGEGEVVDWVVHMRRFDETRTLDHIASTNGLSPDLVSNVVRAVLASHERAPVRDGVPWLASLSTYVVQNDAALAETPEIFPPNRVRLVVDSANAEIGRLRLLLLARGDAGFVRRCHGDLHLRNIALIDDAPVLFDAIEFNESVATCDVLYDLAFLLMDLWERGLREQANGVMNQYLWRSDEAHLDGLAALPLFLSLRAAIRAKVVAASLPYIGASEREDGERRARNYFDLAERFLSLGPPQLVAIGGLSGSGKSTLAAGIAPRVGRPPGAVHIRSDVERKRLWRIAMVEPLPPEAYTDGVTETVYASLRHKAVRVLDAGQSVIVDAVHATSTERREIAAVAVDRSVPFHGLWLEAPLDSLIGRVRARTGDVSDATADVVRCQSVWDTGPIDWMRLDASLDIARLKEGALAAITGQSTPCAAPDLADLRLVNALTEIVAQSAAAVLDIRSPGLAVTTKADGSPVTAADRRSEAIILEGLARLCPALPAVSEESIGAHPTIAGSNFALIDPLDGTAEFLAGSDEFTVNLAIIQNGVPVLGIIAAPALGLMWRGGSFCRAERLKCNDRPASAAAKISARKRPSSGFVAMVSRSHCNEATEQFLSALPIARRVPSGSSAKFCRIAEGAADIYPRLGPTSEWDIAAGHAILAAAGGTVTTPDGGPITYGRATSRFRVPAFIAWGDREAASRFGRAEANRSEGIAGSEGP
jgi:uncharacterized protein